MSPIKEFTTALKEVTGDAEDVMTFTVDGTELTCYYPNDGQLAILAASLGRHSSQHTQIAGIIDFFVEVMDEQSHSYLVERLLDRKDPFGLTEVQDIMAWMMEEWTGRPTQRPSVSTQSQKTAGPRSTRRTTRPTSSVSVPTGS